MRPLPLLALALLAGCAAPAEDVTGAAPPAGEPAGAAAPAEEPAPAPPADAAPLQPVLLVDKGIVGGVPPGFEADVLCALGGGPELEREPDALILPGVAQLAVTVTVPPTSTGLQVGYAIDGGDATWLPPAPPGRETTLTVDVPPEAHEAEAPRWTFHQQHNVFLAPQGCYTGGSVGGWKVRIETVPAE